jgi:multicomponent Na+:H+ antiporter subunit B
MTAFFVGIIDVALLVFMSATVIALIKLRDLFAVVMLFGIFSLAAAALYVDMDAVDVAFTEAAVGAGIATVLMLATLVLVGSKEKVHPKAPVLPLALVAATGAILVYGTLDMPRFGDPLAPIHHHVAPRFIEDSGAEVGPPNIVTSVLASYRGYDTLGEVTVIFTAAAGVLAILGRSRRKTKAERDAAGDGPDPKGGAS